MNFRRDFEDYFDQCRTLGNLSTKSFEQYKLKYASPKTQESPTSLIPGQFYAFYYDSTPNKVGFVNKRPIVFYLGKDESKPRENLVGMDLILMPPKDRLNFMVRYNEVYANVIEQNERGANIPLKVNKQIVETLWGGIPYNFSYRSYNILKMKGISKIDQADWKNLIYLNTKSLEGSLSIEEIYKKIEDGRIS